MTAEDRACGRCEDGCVHGTTTPCPHCKGRMVTAHVEREVVAGEVWQEADNVLLLCRIPGVEWGDFRGDRVPWDAPTIARPLRRLLDAEGNLVPEYLAALPQTGDAAAEVEVREVWALRWPDGKTSSGTYSADGSDYAEQMVRSVAGDFEVVHRTETITRTPWETAPALTAGAGQ